MTDQPVESFPVVNGRTVDDDSQLRAINEKAASQGEADRNATDETNTKKRYNRYQEEFAEYCCIVFNDPKGKPTYTLDRVYNFLYYHAYRPKKAQQKKGEKRKRADTDHINPPKYPKWFEHDCYTAVFDGYEEKEATATDLATGVEYIGYTHFNNIRSALVDIAPSEIKTAIRLDKRIKNLLKVIQSRKRTQSRLLREEKVPAELPVWDILPAIRKLEVLFWEKHSRTACNERVACALRDRWCFNDSFQCIVRAESLWKEELSDMMHYTHHARGEPQPYEVLLRVLWDGKTNQKSRGRALLAQCFRHLEAEKCAIGSKAMYLFSRFLCTQEEFDFLDNKWFDVKTAIPLADRGNRSRKSDDHTKRMGPGTYRKSLDTNQKALGIYTGKLVHIGSKFAPIPLGLDGVPDSEQCVLGNWTSPEGIVFQKHYCAKVPFSAMRSAAGCGKDTGRYYIPRSKTVPCLALQEMVWPNIERSKQKLLQQQGNARFVTAHRFLSVMDYLRVVLLQDAAYFLTQTNDRSQHILFQGPLFQTDLFCQFKEQFAREYSHNTLPQNDPSLKHVQLVVPSIGNTLETMAITTNGTKQYLTEIGQALLEDGERAYQERVAMKQALLQGFQRMESQYLAPISNDIHFIASFIRGGVAGAIGNSTQSPATATGTAALFQEIAAARVSPEDCPVITTTPSPIAPRNLDMGVADCVNHSTFPPISIPHKPVPPSTAFDSVLGMYLSWIGHLDDDFPFKNLFEDTEWRKVYCKKNSAEMKRMQRMKAICSVIDTVVEEHCSVEEMAQAIDQLEKEVFQGGIPAQFSWTRYEKAFKDYHKSRI